MQETLTSPQIAIGQTRPDSAPGSRATGARATTAINRIAYLVSEYPALSHTFIEREIDALEADGFEIHIASIRRPRQGAPAGGESRTEYILPAVPKRLIPVLARLLLAEPRGTACMFWRTLRLALSRPARSLRIAAYLAEALVLLDWMRSREIEHVHNHFGNAAGTVALIAEASGLISFSLSIHGPDIFYDVENELLSPKLERARFSRAISNFCRSQLCLLTPASIWQRFSIVHCGVDPEVFRPRPDPQNEIPEILCVGRLVPAKGQHILLEASRILRDRGIHHRLTLVGDGPDRDSLERTASSSGISADVRFTGGLDQLAVHAEYRRADLFVLPSFAEGVPVVLMEAMLSEIPVISTAITGIPELIRDGVSGLLVPPSSPEALAGAIESLLSDVGLSKRLAAAGRQTVMEEFDLTQSGSEMASLFRSHLAPMQTQVGLDLAIAKS